MDSHLLVNSGYLVPKKTVLMRLRLLQLKNWRKRQRIKHHPAVYLQHHFVILMCLIFIFLQTTEQKAPHIGLGCSLHKQWGLFFNTNGLSTITYPIALSSKPWAIITTEGDPAGWNTSNGIAIAGGDIKTASNTQANILSKWVLNGGTVEQGGQSVLVLIIGV